MNLSFCFALIALTIPGITSATFSQEAGKSRLDSIAIVPWVFEKGTDGAISAARDFTRQVLLKSGLEVREAPSPLKNSGSAGLPATQQAQNHGESERIFSPKQLLELGEKTGVTYVIMGRASWHTRSMWIGLGPKTKSDCTVDLLIVDVARREIAHEARGIKMNSQAKESTIKALGAVFITPLFTAVSGGPKTPHEQRAVQLAIAKALDPWLNRHLSNRKIE